MGGKLSYRYKNSPAMAGPIMTTMVKELCHEVAMLLIDLYNYCYLSVPLPSG
jgi:hypothetical protein